MSRPHPWISVFAGMTSLEDGDAADYSTRRPWIPAFAGMTSLEDGDAGHYSTRGNDES